MLHYLCPIQKCNEIKCNYQKLVRDATIRSAFCIGELTVLHAPVPGAAAAPTQPRRRPPTHPPLESCNTNKIFADVVGSIHTQRIKYKYCITNECSECCCLTRNCGVFASSFHISEVCFLQLVILFAVMQRCAALPRAFATHSAHLYLPRWRIAILFCYV